jgi:predicted cupin superfamily sugar epimerase
LKSCDWSGIRRADTFGRLIDRTSRSRPRRCRRDFQGRARHRRGFTFCLGGNDFSALHRLRSDEIWHFYTGSGLIVHVIDPAAEYSCIRLGSDAENGEVLQAVVRAGCWFASELADRSSFALVGCTVSPGFDFEDFELGKRLELVRCYPQHRRVIERLTRE